ncbi:MAG TPA: PhzF family phenazine biosynthesis protein [Chloroflexia bacterium]|nr:PhzF family phenazine biosynthesis protein [Chloroflexia bacterium]
MADRIFHIVDVFAEERFSGNQLAVFLDGHAYSDAEMRQLAKQFNFSEISFVFPNESSGTRFKARIFTPDEELPFAGHPTLGTAFIVARELLRVPVPEVVLDVPAGLIPVTIEYDSAGAIGRLTMRQLAPSFGPIVPPEVAAQMLGVPVDAIDTRYPVQEVSTGVPFLIVPLRTLDAANGSWLDARAQAAALEGTTAKGVLVFCPQTFEPQNQLNVRVFVPVAGIPEDPATGSANGCLTAYLLEHQYLSPGPFSIRVEQGYQMGRKSILYLAGAREDGTYRIEIGGAVQHWARGTLV